MQLSHTSGSLAQHIPINNWASNMSHFQTCPNWSKRVPFVHNCLLNFRIISTFSTDLLIETNQCVVSKSAIFDPLLVVILLVKLAIFETPTPPPWHDVVYGRPLPTLFISVHGHLHQRQSKCMLLKIWFVAYSLISKYLGLTFFKIWILKWNMGICVHECDFATKMSSKEFLVRLKYERRSSQP